MKAENETLDTFYGGRILVLQKRRGYRFSVDAPLLADFIRTELQDELLELGTGNGIISLLLSIKPFRHIWALEIQDALADLARRNIKLNNIEDRITLVREDFRLFRPGRKFDVVFSNPPYIRKKGGHLSPSLEKSIAKHELTCDISGIMQKTGELMKDEGRACFIYPEKRREDFCQAAERSGLSVRKLRLIHPRSGTPPNLFLTECRFFPGPVEVTAPLVLYNDEGSYMEEAKHIFAGRYAVEAS